MKKILLCCSLLLSAWQLQAQCTQNTVNVGGSNNCNTAPPIEGYVNSCSKLTISNVGNVWGSPQQSPSCGVGTVNHDVYVKLSTHPANVIPSYDGSVVVGFHSYPGYPNNPPTIAIHAEVDGKAEDPIFGWCTINLDIDCLNPAPTQSSDFLVTNIYCGDKDSINNNHLYLPPGSIPSLSGLLTSLQQQGQPICELTDIALWIQAETYDATQTGTFAFEVSEYAPGFLCGDPTIMTLAGAGTTKTASATKCLCEFAGNGGFHEPGNYSGGTAPCPTTTGTSAWFKFTAPFTATENNVALSISGSSVAQNYNISLLSSVVCPDKTTTNPLDNSTITYKGDLMDAHVVEGQSCGSTLNVNCLPAGDYWVVVSGENTKASFTLNTTVTSANCCAANLAVTTNVTNTNSTEQAQVITATNTITGTSNTVIYAAENYVDLKPSFRATAAGTSVFKAYILPCSNTPALMPAPAPTTNEVAAIKAAGTNFNKVHLGKKATITPASDLFLNMAPNPTSESVTLNYNNSSDVACKALVEVIDVQGRTVLSVIDGDIEAASQKQMVLDVSAVQKGIYFVKVTLSNGKSVFQKLVVQ